MTQHTLAILVLAGLLLQLLPGSAYVRKPTINWDGPHVYVALFTQIAVLWLLWEVLS